MSAGVNLPIPVAPARVSTVAQLAQIPEEEPMFNLRVMGRNIKGHEERAPRPCAFLTMIATM
jgi:hypothetical protein